MRWRPVTAHAVSAVGAAPVVAPAPARVTAARLGASVVPRAPADPQRLRVELLWFQDCPNHPIARVMLRELLSELSPATMIDDIDATEPAIAEHHRFPGSPTIRVEGRDVDPSFEDPGDYTPRCRLYRTAEGLRGVPDRAWVDAAVRASLQRHRAVDPSPRTRRPPRPGAHLGAAPGRELSDERG